MLWWSWWGNGEGKTKKNSGKQKENNKKKTKKLTGGGTKRTDGAVEDFSLLILHLFSLVLYIHVFMYLLLLCSIVCLQEVLEMLFFPTYLVWLTSQWNLTKNAIHFLHLLVILMNFISLLQKINKKKKQRKINENDERELWVFICLFVFRSFMGNNYDNEQIDSL